MGAERLSHAPEDTRRPWHSEVGLLMPHLLPLPISWLLLHQHRVNQTRCVCVCVCTCADIGNSSPLCLTPILGARSLGMLTLVPSSMGWVCDPVSHLAGHSNWFRTGHGIQAGSMRILPGTSLEILRKRALFLLGSLSWKEAGLLLLEPFFVT